MPKLKGKNPRILDGDNNPRHYIMIPVGTGNQFCRNCAHLSMLQDPSCQVFNEKLAINARLGPERHPKCRESEKLLFEAKQEARKEGEDAAFFKSNSSFIGKSTLSNAAV